MDLDAILAGNARYGSTPRQLAEESLGGLSIELLRSRVIVAPWWEPRLMPTLGSATLRNKDGARIRLWDIDTTIGPISWVKTGIGAPQLMDTIVALAIAGCRQVIFVGSVGGLVPELEIGDLVVPSVSVVGEGASRYLQDDPLVDVFGTETTADSDLTDRLVAAAEQIATEVVCHRRVVFSIDSVAAQFAHLDRILGLGAEAVEMETSAAFAAGSTCGLPVAALLQVSDNTVLQRSLVSGRTAADHRRRAQVRSQVMPEIILRTFDADPSTSSGRG